MSIIGIPIGFYGYLSPGNINLMVLELYNKKRYTLLMLITLLVLTFESLYCFVTLHFFNKVSIGQQLFLCIEISAYLLTLLMGVWMISERKSVVKNTKNTLYRGVFSAIIHPQQIPFWLFMGVLFHDAIYHEMDIWTLPLFVLANAAGTLLILTAYAFFGNKIMSFFNLNISHINKIAGGIYIVIAMASILNKII
jgi:hypothetical protein